MWHDSWANALSESYLQNFPSSRAHLHPLRCDLLLPIGTDNEQAPVCRMGGESCDHEKVSVGLKLRLLGLDYSQICF